MAINKVVVTSSSGCKFYFFTNLETPVLTEPLLARHLGTCCNNVRTDILVQQHHLDNAEITPYQP